MLSNTTEISTNHTFLQTGLKSFICSLLLHAKYNDPTPIQYHALKEGISGINIVCRSKSGTGKTLAYLGLLLESLCQRKVLENKTYFILLVPTRELAVQVYQTLKLLLDAVPKVETENQEENASKILLNSVEIMLTMGGISFEDDRKKYNEKAGHIMISTVGRMWELMRNKIILMCSEMTLILDEGDKLLDNHDDKFNKILAQLPETSRWIIFSATFNQKMLEQLWKKKKFVYVQTMLKNGELEVLVTDKMEEQMEVNNDEEKESTIKNKDFTENVHLDNIKKYQIRIPQEENLSIFDSKIKTLINILTELSYQKCLVFVEKKSFLEQISQSLLSFDHVLIHGSLSQAARFRMMNRINECKLIIASDLLSRGIDIKLDLVILFDAKQSETFWHRIGRTGRYGRTGVAISLDPLEDENWKDYNCEEINNIFGDVEYFEKKVWYGGHMTEIGKWGEADPRKEEEKNYKYFDEEKMEPMLKEISRVEKEVKEEKNHSNCVQEIHKITNKAEFKALIEKIMKCSKCMDLINGTIQLTGYKFEIFDFVKAL